MNERQKNIIKLLSREREVNVGGLSELTGVSGVTIRQDLKELELKGFLKRTHGGAQMPDSDDINSRLLFNYECKLRIAKKCVEFINEGDTIFIESGSTNAILAQNLPQNRHYTVLTSNAFVARECKKLTDNPVVLMGGMYQKQSDSVVGNITKMCIRQFNFNKAFIGIDGFSIEKGFTSRDMDRADNMSAICEKAQEIIVVSDSTKFGKNALCGLVQTDKVKRIVTDAGIPEKERVFLDSLGIDLVIV